MPSYVSLRDQGFYDPFIALGQLTMQRRERKDKLAAENTRAAESKRRLDLDTQKLADELVTSQLSRERDRIAADKAKREMSDPAIDAALGVTEVPSPATEDTGPSFGGFVPKSFSALTPEQRDAHAKRIAAGLSAVGITVEPPQVHLRMAARDNASAPLPSGLRVAQVTRSPDGRDETVFKPELPALVAKPILTSEGQPSGLVDVGGEVRSAPNAQRRTMLTEGDKAFAMNMNELRTNLKRIREIVGSYGNFEIGFPGALASSKVDKKTGLTSNQAAGELKSLPYRAAIGYAKIVDPATAAREGEVAAASKYAIPMGLMVPNEVTLAAIDSMLTELDRREKAYGELRQVSGLPPVTLPDQVTSPGELPVFDDPNTAEEYLRQSGAPSGTRFITINPQTGEREVAEFIQ